MAYVDFAALKERVTIESVVAPLGLALKERNGQWRGRCPACKTGGDRALVVTPVKRAFYCFGGHTGGDVIALVAHIHGSSMKEAAAFLADDGGEGKRTAETTTVPEERTKEAARSLQPLSYLQPEHEGVQKLGVSVETCRVFGAGYAPKGIMRGRLAIPVHDWEGTLVAYCGRALGDESPTLTFPNGFKPEEHIFGAHQVEGDALMLVRDPLEAMTASQNGIENVVAFLTDVVSAEQLQRLAALMDEKGCDALEIT